MTTPEHSSAARSIFVATLSFLLLSHGGHFYAYDTYLVYRTATQLVDHATLDLTPMWGAVEGVDGGGVTTRAGGAIRRSSMRAVGSSETFS